MVLLFGGAAQALPQYPGPSNSGVPSGTSLTTVTATTSGPWVYTPGGGNPFVKIGSGGTSSNPLVISGYYFPFNVTIAASWVVLQDCQIVSNYVAASTANLVLNHDGAGNPIHDVTIADCTISGQDNSANVAENGIKDNHGDTANLQVLRCQIYWTTTGAEFEQGLMQDTYIWGISRPPNTTFHLNGFQTSGWPIGNQAANNGGALTLRHNTILNGDPHTGVGNDQTDAIILSADVVGSSPNQFQGQQANRLIDNNLLAGGGYPLYGGTYVNKPRAVNVVLSNNKISTMFYAAGGSQGPATAVDADPNTSWINNTWYDGVNAGQPVTRPTPPAYAYSAPVTIKGGTARFPSGH